MSGFAAMSALALLFIVAPATAHAVTYPEGTATNPKYYGESLAPRVVSITPTTTLGFVGQPAWVITLDSALTGCSGTGNTTRGRYWNYPTSAATPATYWSVGSNNSNYTCSTSLFSQSIDTEGKVWLFQPYNPSTFTTMLNGYYAMYWLTNLGSGVGNYVTSAKYYLPIYYSTTTQSITVEGVLPTYQSGLNSTYNTRFLDLNISGTSTVLVDVDWYIDPSEVNRSVPERNPTLIKFSTSLRPSTTFSGITVSIGTTTGTSSSMYAYSGLADGTYDLLIQFYNQGAVFGSPQPFPDSYVYSEFTIASGTLTSVGTPEFYDSTSLKPKETQYEPCGLTAISGCINNSIRFLFVPSESSLTTFTDQLDTMKTKFPFAYAFDFYDVTSSLYTSSTTQNLSLTLPFGDLGSTTLISTAQLEAVPFASTIKTIIASLLWLMFGLFVYRRTLVIFNK